MQGNTDISVQDFIQISLLFPYLTFCIFTVLLQFTH